MKRFAGLFMELDQTNKTSEKVALLKSYFQEAPEQDKVWALALFSGRRPSFKVNRSMVRKWAAEAAGIPDWLFQESYQSVGDLGETIALILPEPAGERTDRTLAGWFDYLLQLPEMDDLRKERHIRAAWAQLGRHEAFIFNKLLMGSFRVGVSATLAVRALSEATGVPVNVIAHRLMGAWDPESTSFDILISGSDGLAQRSKPYPFYLAYPLEGSAGELGAPEGWFAEWKWDGIRAQLIFRGGQWFAWSRGEELMNDKFPELEVLRDLLPEGTVLDGEIVAYRDGAPLPFGILQTRVGRKKLSAGILREAPVHFLAYDLLEEGGTDLRGLAQEERRRRLENLYQSCGRLTVSSLSPLVAFSHWQELETLHTEARYYHAEGFMLKGKHAVYEVGRKKGGWWKWKVSPLSIDAVLVYAQKGAGRRAEMYTDYTFSVWDAQGKLVPFAKAYSGLTDAEIAEVDRFIKRNVLEKFGPVRTVKPELVFEIGFEGINASSRHKSGIAVRFPRILRWRKDKKAAEADTLENLQNLLKRWG